MVVFVAKEVRLVQSFVVLLVALLIFSHLLVVKIFFIAIEVFDFVEFVNTDTLHINKNYIILLVEYFQASLDSVEF